MNSRAQIRLLPDGKRLHLQDGPIDLIVEAFGRPEEIKSAYQAAAARFVNVLDELCAELALLRHEACANSELPWGAIARRMVAAVKPHASRTFITPMAAVAGAVAEEILSAMLSVAQLSRAYVNNGGDIALHLSRGEQFVVGMIERPVLSKSRSCEDADVSFRYSALRSHVHPLFGTATIDFASPIRGIASSGWRGRSFSLGIADAVTVLADTASMADAAATIVANAVDVPQHPAIVRVAARDLAPDSDLGERLVTHAVGDLTPQEIDCALSAGMRAASSLCASGLLRAAALALQGETRIVGDGFGQLDAAPTAQRSLVHA